MTKLLVLSSVCFLVSAESSVYLDYAASANIQQESLDEFNFVCRLEGNSSGFNQHSKVLKQIEQKSTQIIAKKLGCKPEQIVFTNSATISSNIAILGVASRYPNCHIITSKIEHKSVLNVCKHLEEQGYPVTYIGVDRYGKINLEELEKSINKNTRLMSIQSFNSEIGINQDMKKISRIIRKHPKVIFHSDISQSFAKYPFDISLVDMATFSGYKIGAPKGIAALYIKDTNLINPILFGSSDELFPGTKPTALIAAFAKAVENYKWNLETIKKNFEVLKSNIEKIENVFVNSIEPTHVFSVSIAGVLLKDVIQEMKGFSFSSGCSCLGQGESNVKEAIDPEGKLPSCTLRISFSDKISASELLKFSENLKQVVYKLRENKKVTESCENNQSKNKLFSVLDSISSKDN